LSKIKDKRFLNFVVITIISLFSIITMGDLYADFIFKLDLTLIIITTRMMISLTTFSDFKLSWSRASSKTGLIKTATGAISALIYAPILLFLQLADLKFIFIEVIFYLFLQNIVLYSYHSLITKGSVKKYQAVIYGAGKAGVSIENELRSSEYKIINFVDDNEKLQKRSVDGIPIISRPKLLSDLSDIKKGSKPVDLLIIALSEDNDKLVKDIYQDFAPFFSEIKVLPTRNILTTSPFSNQLRNVSIEDLLARHPKDLDKNSISEFIKNSSVLVTGAGGSIGSEICRQCAKYGASQIIMVDHSEFNLYTISDELEAYNIVPVLQSVIHKNELSEIFGRYKPDMVIHAAAYKHVPLVEYNIPVAIKNNILGTKNCIDLAIEHGVKKFVLISTDKAVRPTNVMGATKRVCELYAQNSNGHGTDIVCVRFGNVLNSSGSVIPKFRSQIEAGGPVTVTHPDITRYFMLIPEACELVLQAAVIGNNGQILILDMGEPVKIVDLAKKMISLITDKHIDIVYTGLRPGEKLYEELLINEKDKNTDFDSITIAKPTKYDIIKLNKDIEELMKSGDYIKKIKEIVPEFNHASLAVK